MQSVLGTDGEFLSVGFVDGFKLVGIFAHHAKQWADSGAVINIYDDGIAVKTHPQPCITSDAPSVVITELDEDFPIRTKGGEVSANGGDDFGFDDCRFPVGIDDCGKDGDDDDGCKDTRQNAL